MSDNLNNDEKRALLTEHGIHFDEEDGDNPADPFLEGMADEQIRAFTKFADFKREHPEKD
jgi:hypothetical protein